MLRKNNRNISIYKHIVLPGVLCLFLTTLHSQIHPRQLRNEILESQKAIEKENKKAEKNNKNHKEPTLPEFKPVAPTANPLAKKGATIIYLEKADMMTFDQFKLPDIQLVKGNVRFRHDNAIMFCDSAYFYTNANSLDAFGHVKIVQGDTLFVYGDFLFYDGNQKLARLRHNVKMENRKTVLTTDSLNYDRMKNIAYYFTGGTIRDQVNTLTSIWGQYMPATNVALFRDKVKLVNKDYTMDADTLKYNTRSHIANIVGRTHIIYKNETDIYSTSGWYNTTNDQSMLLKRSLVVHQKGKTMTGDTIFYDKKKKYGEAFNNVILTDENRKNTLSGDYVYYDELKDEGFATDSALFTDWSSKDTMYVHADTVRTSKDSIYNLVRGYHRVRFFRNDVQGLSDSLSYNERDSVLYLHGQPVLWAENNQLSGEVIHAMTKGKKVDKIYIEDNAFASQQTDSIHYNQLSGKEMIAYLDSNQLKKVDVNGNAESVYYPVDDKDSSLVGLNKTQSSYVKMYLKNKKIERVVLTSASSGTMYPIEGLTNSELYLRNFFWIPEQRPLKPIDVFKEFPKTERFKPGAPSKTPGKGGSASGKNAASSPSIKPGSPPKTMKTEKNNTSR